MSAAEARGAALAAVPGTASEVELENENGNVVYGVDVTPRRILCSRPDRLADLREKARERQPTGHTLVALLGSGVD